MGMSIAGKVMFSSTDEATQTAGTIFSHPGIAAEIISVMTDKTSEIPRLLKLISSDPILTLMVLKNANTDIYNHSGKIDSLERAVVVLGFDLVKEITRYNTVKTFFRGIYQVDGFNVDSLWRHSFFCALALKILADQYDSQHKEVLYFSGLLHDIGKIICLHQLGEEYSLLLQKSENEKISLFLLEKKFFNMDHAVVGANLLEKWKFPFRMIQAVRYHHAPREFKSGDRMDFWIHLVYLGNLMVHAVEKDLPGYQDLLSVDPGLQDHLSISQKEFDRLLEMLRREIRDHREIVAILS